MRRFIGSTSSPGFIVAENPFQVGQSDIIAGRADVLVYQQVSIVFRSFLRMQLLSPNRVTGFITHLPSFARVFYRLMIDPRVSLLAKLVPLLGLLLMLTPPALELDFVP